MRKIDVCRQCPLHSKVSASNRPRGFSVHTEMFCDAKIQSVRGEFKDTSLLVVDNPELVCRIEEIHIRAFEKESNYYVCVDEESYCSLSLYEKCVCQLEQLLIPQ